MRSIKTVAGGLIGLIVGYFIGVFVACDWLLPTSNLCGLLGVFITGPIGFVIGAIGGWLISKPPVNSRGIGDE